MAAGTLRALGPLDVAIAERNAVALGVSVDTLMENAGRAVAEEAVRHLPPPPARVAILLGPGNNGGDGSAAAFYLGQWGYTPEVWMLLPPTEIRTAPARRTFERIASRYPIRSGAPRASELTDFPLVVDALLGSGQAGGLRPPYRAAVEAVNAAARPVLAVDVPTGFGTPEVIHAQWTVALAVAKSGVTESESGELVVRDIGIPPEAFGRTGPGEFLLFPVPPPRSRGRTGRLLVVGGGPYAGAPALAGLAALRAGAERATIAAPVPAAETIQGFSPNLVVVPLSSETLHADDVGPIVQLVTRAGIRAVVLGMGLGTEPRTLDAVARLIPALEERVPVVLDADALAVQRDVRGAPAGRTPERVVMTPNSGEFDRYFSAPPGGDDETRATFARESAARRKVTLLVKGSADLLTDGERLYSNTHHHPAMTVGGVGDVIAGVTGALLAQGLPGLAAARLATYWVGEAGTRAAGERSFGLLATDVIESLPGALRDGLRSVRGPG